MPPFAKPIWWLRWALTLTSFTGPALFDRDGSELQGFNVCEILKQNILSAAVRRYSEPEGDLNLLTPVTVALARSKITKLVEQRSQFDCAVTLLRLWRNSTRSNETDSGSFHPRSTIA